MGKRYIQRSRLSARQYTRGCPIVLVTGFLLEDTQQPRLVAQLKWKSISPKEITQVHLRLSQGNFTYTNLHVHRGQAFGQYTAIPFALSDMQSLSVKVASVAFADGEIWVCPEDALWGVLPAFRPAVGSGYVEEKHADLWYCSCGGVNHENEEKCHRCGKPYGSATSTRLAPKVQIDLEAARKEAQLAAEKVAAEKAAREAKIAEERAVKKAAAKKKAAEIKAATEEKAAALKAAAAEKAETKRRKQKEKSTDEVGSVSSDHKVAKKRRKWLLPVFCVVIGFLAAAIVMPLLPNNETAIQSDLSSENKEEIKAPTKEGKNNLSQMDGDNFSVPGATLDYTGIFFHEDGEGSILVDWEHVVQYFDCTAVCFAGIPYTTENIDDYIKDSFVFAGLVCDGMERGIRSDIARTTPSEEGDSTFCLLAFDDTDGTVRLKGYFVGELEHYKNDTWLIKLKHCDYDITELYEKERAAFLADKEHLYANYIAPEDVRSSGAKYFLKGYNTGRSNDPREDDCQMYHLWNELNSPFVERYARDMGRFDRVHVSSGRWVACLLLDKNYNYIGYTMLDS